MEYDLIVIGGGPGGYASAAHAAKHGLRTALIERDRLGGTCLQRGCVPTKAYLHASEHAAPQDRAAMLSHKNEIVQTLTDGIGQLMKAHKVDVYQGMGCVLTSTPPHRIAVQAAGSDTVELCARNVLVATGSAPARLPVPGCDHPGVWTSDDLLGEAGAEAFESLCIIGGGVIGVEMACIYAQLGVQVTIVEAEKICLPMMDRELSRGAEAILKGLGVTLLTGARLTAVTPSRGGFDIALEQGGATPLHARRVLLATGRRPVTDGLFAQGVTPETERGFLCVNEHFRTTLQGVYAIGDVNGLCQLAHAAHAQGLAVVSHLLGECAPIDPVLVPSCVYTTPEIASVGLTQDEARAQGRAVLCGKALTTQNARSLIEGLGRGFIKLILDKDTHVLLGAQLLCGRATDLIGELTLGISQQLTAEQLLRPLRAHPTFYESVTDALEAALK